MLSRVSRPGSILKSEVENDNEPDIHRFPLVSTDQTRMYLHLARFIHKMMDKVTSSESGFPKVFTGRCEGASAATYIDGLDWHGEDIYRALTFQHWARGLGNKKGGKTAMRVVRSRLPELPLFCVEAAGDKNTPAQQQQAAQIMQRDFGDVFKGYLNRINGDRLWTTWAESAHVTDAEAQKNADECATGNDSHGAKRPTLPTYLETLTHEQRLYMMRICSSDIEILYDDPNCQDKTFFENNLQLRAVAEEGERAAKDAGDIYAIRDRKENIEEDELEVKCKAFLRMQDGMNQISARPPTFAEVRDGLHLEVTKNTARSDSNGTGCNYSMKYKGLALKPWQPAAILWCANMMEGPLRAAILGDDTGLSKTVEAMGCIVELSARLEARWVTWRNELAELVRSARSSWVAQGDYDTHEAMTDDEVLDSKSRPISPPIRRIRKTNATWNSSFKFFACLRIFSCTPLANFAFSAYRRVVRAQESRSDSKGGAQAQACCDHRTTDRPWAMDWRSLRLLP